MFVSLRVYSHHLAAAAHATAHHHATAHAAIAHVMREAAGRYRATSHCLVRRNREMNASNEFAPEIDCSGSGKSQDMDGTNTVAWLHRQDAPLWQMPFWKS